MNFISRDDVLAILSARGSAVDDIRREIEALPMFPAPNPDASNNRNVMGQTQEEFWAAVDAQHAPAGKETT
jgi:hypothetical protein